MYLSEAKIYFTIFIIYRIMVLTVFNTYGLLFLYIHKQKDAHTHLLTHT